MEWKPLEDGAPVDFNDANDRFDDFKTEINALEGVSVQRHSLQEVHLPSIVTHKATNNELSNRYTYAQNGDYRYAEVDSPMVSSSASSTSPTTSTVTGWTRVVGTGAISPGPVDIYPDYFEADDYVSTGADVYDIDHDDFVTSPTGLLVMANVLVNQINIDPVLGADQHHISVILEANCGDGTGASTARITIPGSLRYWRNQTPLPSGGINLERQRVEFSIRYLISWKDVERLTEFPHSHSSTSIRYINRVNLLIATTVGDADMIYSKRSISAMRLHHGHCLIGQE
jgi:hypothetical protein